MKTKKARPSTNNVITESVARVASVTVVILLFPLFGNLFIEGWNWGFFDFVIIGLMLFVAGMLLDFAAQKITNPVHRIVASVAIVVTFLLIWVELAVNAVSQMLRLLG